MSMFQRFAKDCSENLFNSVYDSLFELATKQQKQIWQAEGKRGYYVGEAQENLNAFCHNKLSLGDALNFVNLSKVYT